MRKFLRKWNEKSLTDKIVTIIGLVSGVLVIVLALLQLLGVWKDAAFAYMPLLCVNMLALAASNWRPNRSVAIVNLAAAGIMLACIAVVVYSRFAAA